MRIASFCLLAITLGASSGALMGADSVSILATSPTANEEGLVPGKVTFVRTGSSSPLTVRYRISGSGRSDKHGGYVSNVALSDLGSQYRRNFISPITIADGAPTKVAQFSAQGRGGYITAFNVGFAGTNYDETPPPTVTVTSNNSYGSGGAGAAVVRGYVNSVTLSIAGSNYSQASPPSVTFSGGGAAASAAGHAVVAADGSISSIIVDAAGNGYTSVPSVIIGAPGGGGTQASASANLSYNVAAITVTSGGTGYLDDPETGVVIAAPPAGITATATVLINGSPLDSVTLLDTGYGYPLPTATAANATGTPAVLVPIVDGGEISSIKVQSGGSGYAMPGVTIADLGGTGSGAAARVTVRGRDDLDGGEIIGVTLTNPGTGYSGTANLQISVNSGTGSVITGTVSGGQVVDLQVTSGGRGYTVPLVSVTPHATDLDGMGAIAKATVDDGIIVAVDMVSKGMNYGPVSTVAIDDLNTGFETQGRARVQFAGPDFTAPVGATVDANGDLVGTITFNTGELTKDLELRPLRNGVGGGRTATIEVANPLVNGTYIVDQQSSASVTIADADERASIVVNRPVAYPTPPTQSSAVLPIEVQGRGEWQVEMDGSLRYRRMSFMIQNDPAVGPLAVQSTDYLMAYNSKSIDDTASDFVVAANLERVPPIVSGPAKVGATAIPVASLLDIGAVVSFEDPSDVTNGIYVVTGQVAGTDTTNPAIVITPALKKISCAAGTTRIRRLGKLWNTNSIDLYGYSDYTSKLFFFGFPYASTTARARRSIAINFLQTDDYRVLTPTVGTVTVADSAVTTGLRFGANAGKPVSNGHVEVVLTGAFPTDIDVPFYVLTSSTAVLGTDFAIAGVSTSTRIGTVRVPAGNTTARIEIAPTLTSISEARTVEISLLQSPDYQLAPAGTSPVNPTASVTITPAPKTTDNEDVYLSVSTTVNGAEPSTNGAFRITMTNAAGSPLTGTLTQNLGVSYTATGSAVAGVNYQTLTGNTIIPAGSRFVDVPMIVIDDGRVTPDLSLVVSLTSGAGYQVSSQSNTTVTILDAGPRIRVAATTATATRGGSNGAFTFTNTRVVNRDTVIGYSTTGTAVAGTDYTVLPGSVTIPSGQATAVIQVAALSSALGATAASTVVVTLANDTANPTTYVVDSPKSDTVTIPAATPTGLVTSLGEAISYSVTAVTDAQKPSTNGVFRFSLTNATGTALSGTATAPLSIAYTVGGTAAAGSAYTALSGTAIITTGSRSVDVNVVPINNGTTGTTTVSVTIPVSSWPSSVNTATVNIKDAASSTAAAPIDQSRILPFAGGGGGSSGGCGLGSGLGLVLIGGGLAVATALRRRRR